VRELATSPAVHVSVHDSLTTVYLELGRFADVGAHHEKYLALLGELGNSLRISIGTASIVRAELARGNVDEAFDLVLDLLEEARHRVGAEEEFHVWQALEEVLDRCGAHEDALAATLVRLELAGEDATVLAYRLTGHRAAARAYRKLAELESAARHLNAARALRTKVAYAVEGEGALIR
jgi:tetratricopeptide (TPR) repeat protein